MKKKIWIGALIVVAVAAIAILGVYLISKGKNSNQAGDPAALDGSEIYCTRISSLMGLDSGTLGMNQRFSGVVEPQKTVKISLEGERTTSDVFVEVDDEVKAGDPLFRYDTDDLTMKVEQGKLELEKLENSIITQQQQLEELIEQSEDAYGDTLLQYTIQIQEAEVNIKQTEYGRDVKKMEIEKNQKAIDDAIVTSPINGIIRSINETPVDNGYGEVDNSFITIIANGDFRIKGLINEQNVYQISVDTPVTVHSRVDSNITWPGSITEIDTSNPESGNNNNYFGGGGSDAMQQTSRYPFYVQLDQYEELMIGQHVYIEIGGETFAPAHTEGVWLWDGYFFYEDDDPTQPYVWKEKNGKIVKQKVTLGEMDPETGEYQVTEGLTQEDAIAWPDEMVTEGAAAVIMD